MSWTVALCWSLARGVVIASLGLLLADQVRLWLQAGRSRAKLGKWCGVLVPLFVPAVVTGYCYRDTSMSLIHHLWARECLYACIVLMQSVPLAVVLLTFAPQSSVSSSALWIGRLSRLPQRERWRLWGNSAAQYRVSTFCLLFLVNFQEAELASLLQASGWTEWMFTRHASGLELSHTLRLTTGPILIQLPFVWPVLWWFSQQQQHAFSSHDRPAPTVWLRQLFVPVWLCAAVGLTVLVPGFQLLRGMRLGFGNLLLQPYAWREIGDALLIALTVALLTWGLVIALLKRMQFNLSVVNRPGAEAAGPSGMLVCGLLLIPGLMGNLALGLVISGIFQTPLLQPAYDSPLPLLLAEVLALLPKSLILMHCLQRLNQPSSLYLVALTRKSGDPQQQPRGGELWWQLAGRQRFIAVGLVAFWAYFEVMLPALLAMPGLSPVGLVLYNNLHYGRIAALGAKLTLALLVPLLLLSLLLFLRRQLWRVSAA